LRLKPPHIDKTLQNKVSKKEKPEILNAVERISLYEHWEQSVYASIPVPMHHELSCVQPELRQFKEFFKLNFKFLTIKRHILK